MWQLSLIIVWLPFECESESVGGQLHITYRHISYKCLTEILENNRLLLSILFNVLDNFI